MEQKIYFKPPMNTYCNYDFTEEEKNRLIADFQEYIDSGQKRPAGGVYTARELSFYDGSPSEPKSLLLKFEDVDII